MLESFQTHEKTAFHALTFVEVAKSQFLLRQELLHSLIASIKRELRPSRPTESGSHIGASRSDSGVCIEFLKKCRDRLEKFHDLLESAVGKGAPDSVLTELASAAQGLPPSLTLPIPAERLLVKDSDTTDAASAKRKLAASAKSRNLLRSIFRSGKAESKDPVHRFNPVNVLNHQLFLSVCRTEQSNQLQALSELYEVVHGLREALEEQQATYAERLQENGQGADTCRSLFDRIQGLLKPTPEMEAKPKLPLDAIEQFLFAWDCAGTKLLPKKVYAPSKFKSEKRRLVKVFKRKVKPWLQLTLTEFKETEKICDLFALQLAISEIRNTHSARLEPSAEAHPNDAFGSARTRVSEAHELLHRAFEEGHQNLQLEMSAISERLIADLRNDFQPRLLDEIARAELDGILVSFEKSLAAGIRSLPNQQNVTLSLKWKNGAPVAKSVSVPFREIAEGELLSVLSSELKKIRQRVASQLQQALRSIAELDQIVEFNIESAENLLMQENQDEVVLAKVHEVADEGLTRTLTQIDAVRSTITELKNWLKTELHRLSVTVIVELQNFSDAERVAMLKVRLAKARSLATWRQFRKEFGKKIIHLLPTIKEITGKLAQDLKRYARKWGKWARIAVPATTYDGELTHLLIQSQRRLESLPYIYRRLFRFEALVDRRFWTSRDDELTVIRNEYDHWCNHWPASVAIIGEKGSGKTSLVNLFLAEAKPEPEVIKVAFNDISPKSQGVLNQFKQALGVPEAGDFQELADAIANRKERRLCIVENLHNLYERSVSGFDALEELLLLITQTQNKIFWVFTSSLYGWRYLDKILQLNRCFSRCLSLRALTRKELMELILKRHRVSGYNVEYLSTYEKDASRKLRKVTFESDRQQILMEMFFEELSQISAGNIRIAMNYWLNSIKNITKSSLQVESIQELDLSFVSQLPLEETYTLASLLQQEQVTIENHAAILRISAKSSRLILERMSNRGLLERTSNSYQVHPFIYRPAVKALKGRNFIH